MGTKAYKRRLSAILHADVKGYSRLMGEDEDATLETLTLYLNEVSTLIQLHHGRTVGTEGDAILAEFSSVVSAVECAVKIQETLKVKNLDLPQNRQMEFRIGVNLGEVIQDGEQIYGNGVNIAARIQALADGGGISISETVYDQIVDKLALGYDYQGQHHVKNIKKPVKTYRVLMDPKSIGKTIGAEKDRTRWKKWAGVLILGALFLSAWILTNQHFKKQHAAPVVETASEKEMAYPLPEKPSIAVLPFDNMSSDPNQGYLADGISENIITALSIVPEIFVIARNSTFTYKGKSVKVQQVSEDLGVKYVLEGSVQKSNDRIRVTAQLIDAISGHHLWVGRYDRDLTNLFDLQDEITLKILQALQIELAEGAQASKRSTTSSLEAWGLTIKGINLFERFSKEDNFRARKRFKQAVTLDPKYAKAWTMLAWTHLIEAWMDFGPEPFNSIHQAAELAKTSSTLNAGQSDVHSLLSLINLLQKKYDMAIVEGEKAIASGPNNSLSHILLSDVLLLTGRFDKAVSLAERAIRLAPHCADWYFNFLGQAYRQAGRYEDALVTFKESLERSKKNRGNPIFGLIGLADVTMQLGRKEEARTYAAKILGVAPGFSLEDIRRIYVYENPNHLERILINLRKAGLPEKNPLKTLEKPSIAVLPFVNMSDDPSQEYFSDGITEDLITDLSRVSGLFVIARNSVFTYKGKNVKIGQIGRELNVRYVLEGSVRKAGEHVRINAQLIDASTGGHVWAERYDRSLSDIFTLQDDVTRKIVAALVVKLTKDEKSRLARKGTDNIEAYDFILRGVDYFYRFSPDENTKARKMFKKAIALDPKYAKAYTWLGWTYWMAWAFEWSKDSHSLDRALEWAQKALSIDGALSMGHSLIGKVYLWQKQHDLALIELKKATALNPNYADGIAGLGEVLHFSGKPEEAIVLFKKAIRLNPIPPVWYFHSLGSAYFMAGRYDEAVAALKRVVNRNPNFWPAHIYMAASYIELGQEKNAQFEVEEVLKIIPDIRLISSKKKLPYKDSAVFDRLIGALQKAGLK